MSGRCLETKVQYDKNVVHLLIYTLVTSVISAEPFLTLHCTVIPRHTGKHWLAENQLWISRWWTHQIVQLPHLVLVEYIGWYWKSCNITTEHKYTACSRMVYPPPQKKRFCLACSFLDETMNLALNSLCDWDNLDASTFSGITSPYHHTLVVIWMQRVHILAGTEVVTCIKKGEKWVFSRMEL